MAWAAPAAALLVHRVLAHRRLVHRAPGQPRKGVMSENRDNGVQRAETPQQPLKGANATTTMKALTGTDTTHPDVATANRPGRDATIYQVADRAVGVHRDRLPGAAPHGPGGRLHPGAGPRRRRRAADSHRASPARSLAEGTHAANGIVFPDLSGPYFAEVVLGYEEVAAELGRSVLILSTHGRQAARRMVLDLAARVDGLVVLGRTVGDDVLGELTRKHRPLVLMARDPVPGADSVNTENADSARALAEHLVGDHGYRVVRVPRRPDEPRRTSPSAGPASVPPCGPRGCRHRGRRLAVRLRRGERSLAAATRLLRRRPPRVLFCANDEIALGAVTAAEELGLRVPQDLAVTGWDDVMAARHARPGLTTVRQPMRELGAWAARRLHERLAGDASEPRHEVLPTQLVRRASCGHHPKEERDR